MFRASLVLVVMICQAIRRCYNGLEIKAVILRKHVEKKITERAKYES